MSFTPGPWAIELESESNSIVNRNFDGDEWCIAEVYRLSEIDLANARLIAAAPELLEALEALTGQLEKHGFAGEWFSTQMAGAKAVIAKARGEGV